MSLDAVLNRYQELNDASMRVFARERPSGVREFDIMTVSQAWQETVNSHPSHLYEVLAGPCEVYLDIEWKCKSRPDNEEVIVNNVIEATAQKLTKLYGVDVSSCKATASGRTTDGLYKCSWHVSFKTPGVMWASAKHVGDFVKQNLHSFSCVDLSPYNAPKQNWRCVGSSKQSDPARVLEPMSKTNFLKCIVQQDHTNSQIVGCRESLKVPVSLPYTAQKLINQFSNVRQGAAHLSSASDRFVIVPFLSQICPIANRKHRSNHQYAVLDLKCMRWKHCCHNDVCKQKIQIWQPMPDFRSAKLLLPPCAPVRIASKVDESSFSAVADLVVRARGPPPTSSFSKEIQYIKCCNGLFFLPNT